jgi:glyoxylase-like metal-dependent hydrolase (beta-lactamase superfamily II)
LPISASGQLQFIDVPAEGLPETGLLGTTKFTDNISLRFVNGHTDMMMLPQINYKDKTIVFMADLLPSHGYLPIPYVMAYDMFPLKTLLEKKQFLKEAVENNYILFFEHDPVNECCSLQQTDRGVRQKEVFKLEEL